MAFLDFSLNNIQYLLNTDEILIINFDKTTNNIHYTPYIEINFEHFKDSLILISENVEYLSELHNFIVKMTTMKSPQLYFMPNTKEFEDATTNS